MGIGEYFLMIPKKISPMISVIIPAYNVETHIAYTITSVLEQHPTAFEIIIIDDGSTDSTGMIADAFALEYPYVRVFHVTNGGVCKARNIGLEKIKSEYVIFLDGDDRLAPNVLRKASEDITHYKPDMIVGHRQDIDFNGIPRRTWQRLNPFQKKTIVTHIDQLPQLVLCVVIWVKVIKVSVLRNYNVAFPEGIWSGEDYYVSNHLLTICKIILAVPYNICHHVMDNQASITKSISPHVFEDFYYSIKALQESLPLKIENVKYFNIVMDYFYSQSYIQGTGGMIRRFKKIHFYEKRNAFFWFVKERNLLPKKYTRKIPQKHIRVASRMIRKNAYIRFMCVIYGIDLWNLLRKMIAKVKKYVLLLLC